MRRKKNVHQFSWIWKEWNWKCISVVTWELFVCVCVFILLCPYICLVISFYIYFETFFSFISGHLLVVVWSVWIQTYRIIREGPVYISLHLCELNETKLKWTCVWTNVSVRLVCLYVHEWWSFSHVHGKYSPKPKQTVHMI